MHFTAMCWPKYNLTQATNNIWTIPRSIPLARVEDKFDLEQMYSDLKLCEIISNLDVIVLHKIKIN